MLLPLLPMALGPVTALLRWLGSAAAGRAAAMANNLLDYVRLSAGPGALEAAADVEVNRVQAGVREDVSGEAGREVVDATVYSWALATVKVPRRPCRKPRRQGRPPGSGR